MKSIPIDANIESHIRSHFGGDAPAFNDIVVFEATVLSTRPLDKDGTIWERARNTRATLAEMAEWVNGGNQVPLHTNHLQGYEMPVGRFFYGEVFDLPDGHSELRALFYLPKSETKFISDIETGVIQALSVGISHKAILCSECGWDYLSEESDYVNLIERVCANGHEIGKDGVHAVGAGLKKWRETSLVSLGASKDAAIHSRSKTRLTPAQQIRLAASDGSKDITLVATIKSDPEELEMDLSALVEKVEKGAVELNAAQTALKASQTELQASQARVAELEAALQEAESKLSANAEASAKTEELTASLTAATEASETALTFLQDQAVKALVASGTTNPEAPKTIADCISAIETSGKLLANLFAGAGNSVAADAGTGVSGTPSTLAAFKVKA